MLKTLWKLILVGVTSAGADTDLKVTMGQTNNSKVHIDTSLFSSAFKTAFKTDGLGVFTKTGAQASKFDIDSKQLTSNTAMAAGSNAVSIVYTSYWICTREYSGCKCCK